MVKLSTRTRVIIQFPLALTAIIKLTCPAGAGSDELQKAYMSAESGAAPDSAFGLFPRHRCLPRLFQTRASERPHVDADLAEEIVEVSGTSPPGRPAHRAAAE